jgi:hypothetical protein
MDTEQAWSEYNSALRTLQNAGAGKNDGLEQRYALAYQRLVRLGAAQQIRRKYRGR